MTTEQGEFWRPEFTDDSPDFAPLGVWVARSQTSSASFGVPEEQDEGLSWTIMPARNESYPRVVLLGELVVRAPSEFAAVTVVAPMGLRDEVGDDASLREVARRGNEAVNTIGPWISNILYDYAATQLRAIVAGSGFQLEIPFGSPPPHLRNVDEEDIPE